MADIQAKTAFLPDYGFRPAGSEAARAEAEAPSAEARPAVGAGTSVSGIVGGVMTLALAGVVGFALKARSARRAPGSI